MRVAREVARGALALILLGSDTVRLSAVRLLRCASMLAAGEEAASSGLSDLDAPESELFSASTTVASADAGAAGEGAAVPAAGTEVSARGGVHGDLSGDPH